MKKITAIILAALLIFPFSAFGAENAQSSYNTVKGISDMISTYGIYGDFDGEDLYLQTLTELIDNHPELYTEVLKTLLSVKDPYGQYYTKEEKAKLLSTLSGSVEGIGVRITQLDKSIIVSQVLENTPAKRAGLLEGDIVISADGTSLDGMDLDVATSYVQGAAGTTVCLTVKRDDSILSFNIVREKITESPVEYKILDGNIGYIKLDSFTNTSAAEFNNALSDLGFKKINNVIIDVRNNTGGYLSEAVKIADYFLPKGKVITTEDHKLDILDRKYTAGGLETGYNCVILINEYSASASEVLCAALVENGAAVSIGQNSYGKGTVQTMVDLPDGGMMKYTTAFYLTPEGKNINEKGIAPDISVSNTEEPLDISVFTELKYTNTYSVGISNPEIKNAKEILSAFGLYHGEINEYFDENLKIAVAAIQKSSNYIPETGTLDPVTQIEILKMMCSARVEIDNQLNAAVEYFKNAKRQ